MDTVLKKSRNQGQVFEDFVETSDTRTFREITVSSSGVRTKQTGITRTTLDAELHRLESFCRDCVIKWKMNWDEDKRRRTAFYRMKKKHPELKQSLFDRTIINGQTNLNDFLHQTMRKISINSPEINWILNKYWFKQLIEKQLWCKKVFKKKLNKKVTIFGLQCLTSCMKMPECQNIWMYFLIFWWCDK